MNWFKFYGQDWMTDLKVMRMRMEDRLCFITLLCLASSSEEQGVINDCDEETIISLTHLPNDPMHDFNPYEQAVGCLKRFEELGMIKMNVTERNGVCNARVTLLNFTRRQEHNLSNAERQKNYRERLKQEKIDSNKSNVTQRNDNNTRIDKNRIDKKRKDISIIENDKEPDISEQKKKTRKVSDAKSSQELVISEKKVDDVAEIIDLFKNLNPTHYKLFGNKTQRKAVEGMLKHFGRQKIETAIAFAERVVGVKYAPVITTPYQLETKWGELQAFYLKAGSQPVGGKNYDNE